MDLHTFGSIYNMSTSGKIDVIFFFSAISRSLFCSTTVLMFGDMKPLSTQTPTRAC